jgi:hypothetical protein
MQPTAMTATTLPTRSPGADIFFKLAVAVGVFVAILEIAFLVYSPIPYDMQGFAIGRDFVNTWVGGKLALMGEPGPYFAVDAYNSLLQENFGAGYPRHIWSYPPHLLLFTWPLALVPYLPAYILYCLLGLILYVAITMEGERRWDHIVLLALAPAVTLNIWTGQNGFVTTALLLGGLLQLDRRPILAGVLFGILTIKPQLGVLLPVMLVLTGRWRTLAAAAVTTVVLVAITSLAFGPAVWTDYLYDAMPVQKKAVLVNTGIYMLHMPSLFINVRLSGLPLSVAYGAQAILSAVTLAAVAWVFRRRRDPFLSTAFLICAIFLVTPYSFNYDMVVFGWVMIKLMERSDTDAWDYAIMLAVWALPFAVLLIGAMRWPIAWLPILAMAGRLLWRMYRAEQRATADTPVTAAVPAGAR